MKNLLSLIYLCLLVTLFSCGDGKQQKEKGTSLKPTVSENGKEIKFNENTNLTFIKTQKITSSTLQSEMTFPARVAATSVVSQEGAGRNLILFEDAELTANYMLLIQHLANIDQIQNVSIKQRMIELDRAKDLAANGAATGKEVLEAQTALAMERTNLSNERASLIEHETKLKLAGFEPKALIDASPGKIWVICEIPESLLQNVQKGNTCSVQFSSMANEKFMGSIDAIGDVVNSSTRMVKLRLAIKNTSAKMKAGMFATVSFNHIVTNALSVPKQALIIVQGKIYVFVKIGEMNFERREVIVTLLGDDRAMVVSGLRSEEEVVTEGAMQLKGLSFGY